MKLSTFTPYTKSFRKAFLIIPFFVVIDVFCEIVQPRLMSIIVDDGILHKDINYILKIGLAMIGLAIVAIVANLCNIYYSAHASVGFATNLRTALFRKIQSFAFADTDYFSSASLTTRLTNDTNMMQQVMMMCLRMLLRAPLMMVFAIIFAISINKDLSIVMAIALPILALSIFILLRKGLPFFIKMQQAVDRVNSVVQENLLNVRVVKAFVRQDFEKKKFDKVNFDLMDVATKASSIVVLIMPVMQLVMGLSLGGLMSFLSYITQILISLMLLSLTFMMISRAIASGDRIEEVLEKQPSLSDTVEGLQNKYAITAGRIAFQQVTFRYNKQSEKPNLDNISFDVKPASTLAIIGGTGSGKSTLVQLIPRLYDVSEGSVLVDGIDVRNYQLQELRRQIAIVLQQNQLFSGTILENLKWGNEQATDEDIYAAARIACADDFIRSFPAGYQTLLGQGGVNVSGGQKQRICIARALLKKPKILIMDDSTSAVDIDTDRKIREGLKNYLQDTTQLIIAQRISSVMHADQILVMEEGRIVGSGSHEVLLQTNTIYQEIYQSQHLQKEEA